MEAILDEYGFMIQFICLDLNGRGSTWCFS